MSSFVTCGVGASVMYVGISSVIVVAATDDNALRVDEEVAALEVRRRESIFVWLIRC